LERLPCAFDIAPHRSGLAVNAECPRKLQRNLQSLAPATLQAKRTTQMSSRRFRERLHFPSSSHLRIAFKEHRGGFLGASVCKLHTAREIQEFGWTSHNTQFLLVHERGMQMKSHMCMHI
jgi:hypothetical protein